MAKPTSLHVLLAGGGTGGHVFPALAVGDELRARGWRVSFAGMAGGIEERLAGERGIPFHPLPARPLVGRGLGAKVGALTTLVRSAGAAKRLIREIGADVVLGTGGYVSAPAVIGARRAGRPVLLLEPNGKAGVANRWLSRWATAADVGYRETMADLKCPSRLTGVPVRPEFFAVPAEVPMGPFRLLVLGGSQGARQINEAMPAAAKLLLAWMSTVSILHQAGARNLEAAKAAYAREGAMAASVEVVPFLDDVAGAMAASHLVISRAGAITIAEICAAGRASVLVPLAIAKAHQMDNARLLVEAGGAVVIPSNELSPMRLVDQIIGLLSRGPGPVEMGRAARSLARPRAAADIADHLEELGGAR